MKKSDQVIQDWFKARKWQPFPFQEEVWQHYNSGFSGILNAPTGSGKTYALWMAVLKEWIDTHPKSFQTKGNNGLQLLWVTPLRALSLDIKKAIEQVITELDLPWRVGIRTGDTTAAERQKQKRQMPEVMIITPESLHILLAQKEYPKLFKKLRAIVADEWHELLGTKRGVQVELALSRLRNICPEVKIWGVSATIGNLEEAKQVLLGMDQQRKSVIVKADLAKNIHIETILPDEIERFPWAGHLGIKLLDKLLPVIENSRSTLIFTNTRSQTEIWYQYILEKRPDWAGSIAVHHGSLDRELRYWVEEALHEGALKAVVCTSSLDLGVDFRPVETVVQIGSPKGVSRFLQRAGRSGHQPGAVSRMYFLPTHALELVEASALKKAAAELVIEDRDPVFNAYDVLVQYLITLAVSDGFIAEEIFLEIKSTYAFQHITEEDWRWALIFISTGGKSLHQYREYKKVAWKLGKYIVEDKRVAQRHRLSMGTIVGDLNLKVKYITGGYLGSIEESFLSKLRPGDIFWFAGKPLEFVKIDKMAALVRKAKSRKGIVPSWMGGRIPLTSKLSSVLRKEFTTALSKEGRSIEIQTLKPLFDMQQERSVVPHEGQLLIEMTETKDGYHMFIYPFEGRLVHEVLGALIGYRIGKMMPISFSIAMNDYGFELLSDVPIPIEEALEKDVFTTKNLVDDIYHSVNATEMAKRKFRDIATISGLIFPGFPHKMKAGKHLQASSSLLFQVLREYEPESLLIKQAYQEAFDQQIEEGRLREALLRITKQEIVVKYTGKPTPFAFPILVDRLREEISSEKLEDRVKRMQREFERS